jgi:hypothetical protein
MLRAFAIMWLYWNDVPALFAGWRKTCQMAGPAA